MSITFDKENLNGFLDEKDFQNLIPDVEKAHQDIELRTGLGSEFTGWVDLPGRIEDSFLDDIDGFGKKIRENSDALISIGIGGSYLGIHASVEFLVGQLKLPVHFAGHNLSVGYLSYLLKELEDKRVTVVVISKSGTTTEPALAFRVIMQFMQKKYSAQKLKDRVICITDSQKGALRKIAQREGFKSFEIDRNVGGRFSIFTPAGLVPLAIAGIDVKGLINGAREGQSDFSQKDLAKNIAYQYAAARFLLYKQDKGIEVLSTFYQRLSYIAEWWRQLFGESEGKDGKGIFPASLSLTTDLHSMGQLMQEGHRNMFETFLMVDKPGYSLAIPKDDEDLDNFNCVAGQDLDFVNKQAYKATSQAHYEGGVPNMTIAISESNANTLGQLYYFFEKAVAMTGYLIGVNPFNQPGVEAYKTKMFELLGRKKAGE